MDEVAHRLNFWNGGYGLNYPHKTWAFVNTRNLVDGAHSMGICDWESVTGKTFKEVSLKEFLKIIKHL